MQTLTVPQGAFALARYPLRANDPFRAWDSADEYLLDHLHAEGLPARDSSVLILNDGCGALAAAPAPDADPPVPAAGGGEGRLAV
mgnify:CR=1 FL=1